MGETLTICAFQQQPKSYFSKSWVLISLDYTIYGDDVIGKVIQRKLARKKKNNGQSKNDFYLLRKRRLQRNGRVQWLILTEWKEGAQFWSLNGSRLPLEKLCVPIIKFLSSRVAKLPARLCPVGRIFMYEITKYLALVTFLSVVNAVLYNACPIVPLWILSLIFGRAPGLSVLLSLSSL